MQDKTTTTATRKKTGPKIGQREINPWAPEYDSNEQQDRNCLNQHSTEYQLQENQ